MKLQVIIDVTIENNFIEDSLIHMGYNNLSTNNEQNQQRFFEKTLSREEISDICNTERNIRNIPGILNVNYIRTVISKKTIKWYLHPIAIIIYLTIANIINSVIIIENIVESKTTVNVSSIVFIMLPNMVYFIVELSRYTLEKIRDE